MTTSSTNSTRTTRSRAAWLMVVGSILVAACISLTALSQDAKAPAGQGRASRFRVEEDMVRRDFNGNCLASGCHAQLNKTAWVHSPVAVGACETCHAAEGDASAHKFRTTRSQDQLCNFCHLPPRTKEFTHKAFTDSNCLGCHDPHGGNTSALLDHEDGNQLCGGCHEAHKAKPPEGEESGTAFAFLHAPVREGKCLDCHRAHQSDHRGLLLMPERALCLKCHEKTTKSLATASHIHKPLEADCSSCHTAHGSSETALLRERPAVLCTSCHQDVAQQMALQTHDVHGALAGEGSCLHCHTPHVGTTPQLIKTPLSEGCFQCHGKELRLPSGTISNVAATIQARKFKHGPVGTGDCAACHESHASVHGHLLKGEFSESFYEPFSEGKFALCFGCHDKALVTEERTTRTAFRDGDRNLHHVHVHREKGRTCGVCHEPHASDSPALMRQSIPFGTGGWELPIRFARTETGGTCASGCHQELSYDNGRRPQQAGSPSPGAAPTPTGKDEETEKE